MSDSKYKPIVGLEIHVQLCTKTKMFCGCGLEFAAAANSRVCPVCLGMPGVLPVMNKQAVEYAILAGLALNCQISEFTKWDRKSYYYPDLPKNYQISQYDLPLGKNGAIEIPAKSNQTKKVRIIRAHLEEDAGKNIHTEGNFSQVDLNRAGTPLLEIVTAPDMNSGSQVRLLATELQRLVRYLGVSEADMQKGHMRFEPNVNLIITKGGRQFRTPIVEIKNLNSFQALERSVDFEIQRQLDEFEQTSETIETGNKTTRGWDAKQQITVLQRQKEEAEDYRYFPDPDLVPVVVTEDWLGRIKSRLCELPLKKQIRFVTEYKLSNYDAGVLTSERSAADFFEQAVKAGGKPKRVCNLITQEGLRLAKEKGCNVGELDIKPQRVADLAKRVEEGDISASASSAIFINMLENDKEPLDIARELNLIQKSDIDELEAMVEQVIAENPKAVTDARGESKKAGPSRGFLIGQVMKKTAGKANPRIVRKILEKRLN